MSSPDDAAQTMINNLKEKTGKSLEEWLPVVSSAGISKHGEIVNYLKKEHSITHGYAVMIAHKFLKSDASESEADTLVEAQYAGAKAGLKPIYEKLTGIIAGFGSDVEFAPKKAYVSIRRKKQFAIIQPSTASRLDLGINLKDTPPSDNLEASGSWNIMVSHRVKLTSTDQVDDKIAGWLKKAYEQA